MKNVIICKSCNSENPFYGLICHSCKSYLRERIYNIDLWNITGLLIENPSKAFKAIIFSEHKNYLILLIILIAAKLFLNGILLTIYLNKWNAYIPGFLTSYFIIMIFTVVIIVMSAAVFGFLTKRSGIETKFKDNYSILIYSFLPYAFGLLILFLIELVVFGETLFYYEPSPFILKPAIAYILLAFESIIILWSVFLTFAAFKVQSLNTVYSLVFSVFIHITLYFILYFISSSVYL